MRQHVCGWAAIGQNTEREAHRPFRVACGAVSALILAGCADHAPPPSHTVRDSAGIAIVESTAPGWDRPWRLADAPDISIGVTEGPEWYQFSDLVNAFLLPDGRIVAANRRRPAEIRIYDQAGEYIRTLGREGAGPGEFQLIFFADRLGDAIRAYDPGNARITRFTADGQIAGIDVITNVGPDPATRFILFPGLSDGGFLGRSNAPRPESREPGRRNGMSELVLTDPIGAPRTPPLQIVDGEWEVSANGAGLLLFSPRAATIAADSLVYVGSGADFTIDVFGPDLKLRRRQRRAYQPRPVTEELAGAHLAERAAAVPDPNRRAQLMRSLEGRAARSHVPAHDATFLVDTEGSLWVKGYPVPGDERQVWSVFDARGAWLGEIAIPMHLRILAVTADRILAVATDSLDVQRLEIRRLLKD